MRKLGNLQLEVLLAAVVAGRRVTASRIYDKIADANGKEDTPGFAPVYTTVMRLADKGFLTLEAGEDETGRQRKLFTVSAEGRSAIERSTKTMRALNAPGFAPG
ncbi:MAG TPA: helix-turn-helix transcriptional regulator [Allosphingosinicella sp.]